MTALTKQKRHWYQGCLICPALRMVLLSVRDAFAEDQAPPLEVSPASEPAAIYICF